MSRARERKRVPELVFGGTALLMACFFIGEMDYCSRETPGLQIAEMTAGFALLILLAFPAVRLFRDRIRLRRGRLVLLLAAAIIPRVIWWTAVPPRIDSDYGLYVRLASEYAAQGTIGIDNYLLTVAPNAALYAVLLGLLMRVFGISALTAQAACMAAHVGNIFLLYGIGKKITSTRRAFLAAFLFALLPENVFYSTLPGVEAFALCTMLAGLLLVLCAEGKDVIPQALLWLGGGMLLTFSACIRPNAWAAAAAAVIWLPGRKAAAGFIRRKGLLLLAFALGAAAVLLWHQAFRDMIFAGAKPANGIGWTLYEGLDLESGGRWTQEKSNRCIEVIGAYSPAEANRIFLDEAMARFRGYSLIEKIRLFLRKEGSLWYESRYSLFSVEGPGTVTVEAFRKLNDFTAFAWAGCLAAWIRCLIYRSRHFISWEHRAGCMICLFIVLATSAWHAAATSIGRYHYMLIPFVLLMLGMMLPGRGEEKSPVKER